MPDLSRTAAENLVRRFLMAASPVDTAGQIPQLLLTIRGLPDDQLLALVQTLTAQMSEQELTQYTEEPIPPPVSPPPPTQPPGPLAPTPTPVATPPPYLPSGRPSVPPDQMTVPLPTPARAAGTTVTIPGIGAYDLADLGGGSRRKDPDAQIHAYEIIDLAKEAMDYRSGPTDQLNLADLQYNLTALPGVRSWAFRELDRRAQQKREDGTPVYSPRLVTDIGDLLPTIVSQDTTALNQLESAGLRIALRQQSADQRLGWTRLAQDAQQFELRELRQWAEFQATQEDRIARNTGVLPGGDLTLEAQRFLLAYEEAEQTQFRHDQMLDLRLWEAQTTAAGAYASRALELGQQLMTHYQQIEVQNQAAMKNLIPNSFEYLPGYEPGGLYSKLAQRIGIPFDPQQYRRTNMVPFQPITMAGLEQYIRAQGLPWGPEVLAGMPGNPAAPGYAGPPVLSPRLTGEIRPPPRSPLSLVPAYRAALAPVEEEEEEQ